MRKIYFNDNTYIGIGTITITKKIASRTIHALELVGERFTSMGILVRIGTLQVQGKDANLV